eukprot:2859103-Pyramimonas_sp.AAC.1
MKAAKLDQVGGNVVMKRPSAVLKKPGAAAKSARSRPSAAPGANEGAASAATPPVTKRAVSPSAQRTCLSPPT